MGSVPDVIARLRREMKALNKPENCIDAQQFHKEKLKRRYVLRTGLVRKVSGKYFKEIRRLPKGDIFRLAEALLDSGVSEERAIAFDWAYRIRSQFAKSDFTRFKGWLRDYVSDWGSCDHFSGAVLGEYLLIFPEMTEETLRWTNSRKRWEKRAAAVSLIPSLRQGKKLDEAFEAADMLLADEDDLIQKAYGWTLKVAADRYRDEVFEYVMKNRSAMPRTALHYAIEKMPEKLRRKAMAK